MTTNSRPSLLSRVLYLFNTIGTRLLIAFGIVSATTILASTVAFITYMQLGDTVDTLTTATLPAMEASLNVVARSSNISAEAPALFAARTQPDAAAISNQIAG